MKRLCLFQGVLTISISLLSFFLSPSPLFAQPAISLDREIINFGKVAAGSNVQRSFTFRNTGDEPLVIERLKPG